MSHWDASERGEHRGERSIVHTLGTYVQPPVPTNVDIQVDSFNTVISDLSQVSLEYDYHGLPGEE